MIDLHVLDRFARDHLHFEAKCSQCFQNPTVSTPPTDAEIICGLDQIRSFVMTGSIDDACEICEKLCSQPIEDPRVQLNVRIHKLYELIHIAENIPREKVLLRNEALQKALFYSQQLASFALNAFPEAYPMFVESMMFFAYPERTSTVDAIEQRRATLADDLVSLTRMTVCARESKLSFLIRYLLLIYIQFKSPVMTPGEVLDPLEDLIRELLEWDDVSAGRTSRIKWKTDGSRPTRFSHRGKYEEVDVQTLPERVNISRQDSIESLRFTDGDVSAALRNELGRVLVNRNRFRKLIVEYCAARGLHVFETTKTNTTPTSNPAGRHPALFDDQDRVIVPEGMLSTCTMDMFSAMYKLRVLSQKGDCDAFLAAVQQIGHELLERAPFLDFRIGQCRVLRHMRQGEYDFALHVVQQKLGPLAEKHPELLPSLTETTTLLVFASDLSGIAHTSQRSETERGTRNDGEHTAVVSLPPTARAGDKRIRHTRLRAGDTAVASTNADRGGDDQSFEDFLANALAGVTENASLESITAEAYKAYEMKFREPELVQLLKLLIPTQEEWQIQNMMTDKFSGTLGLDELRGTGEGKKDWLADGSGGSQQAGHGRNGGGIGGERGAERGNRRIDRNQRRDEQRENTVLTLMEFLAISRAEALAVVRNHPHADNAQAILDSLLGTML